MNRSSPADAARADESRPHGQLRPIDVLGVPWLPPGRLTRVGNRVRAMVARVHRGMAPPPAQLFEAALASLDVAALAALCRLDVPDRLTEPTTRAALAERLAVDEHRLDRLLRYAATRGWIRIDRNGWIRPTRVTAFLRREHPGGWRAWIEFAAGLEVTSALAALDAGLAPDGDAFEAANGAPFFAWMTAHPQRHATFDAAMAAGARMHGLVLARSLSWSSSERVCDIGGGDGTLLGVLLARHAHLDGVLLELPEVIDRAPRRARVTAVAGDAFAEVPPGCDTYLLVNVLHDWDDRAAGTLLRRAADALASAGPGTDRRVVVVETEAHQRPRDDIATRADVLMLALTPGGRERTEADFTALADGAGLELQRSLPLASGDTAYVFTPVP